MTDRLTEQEIEAVCEALEAADIRDDGYLIATKALAAIRQLQNPWLPIDSAPRDGTRVLVLKDGETYAAKWMKDPQCWGVNVKDEKGWTPYTNIGPARFDGIQLDAGPTHWMPLPPPPETGQ